MKGIARAGIACVVALASLAASALVLSSCADGESADRPTAGGTAERGTADRVNRGHEGPAASRPRDLPTVRRVKREHEDEILRRYEGAVGVAVGSAEDPEGPIEPSEEAFVIVVYLERSEFEPEAAQAIEGVPIKFVTTGPFRAQ